MSPIRHAPYEDGPADFAIGLKQIPVEAWLEGGEAEPWARKDPLFQRHREDVFGETPGSEGGQAEVLGLIEEVVGARPPPAGLPDLQAAARLVASGDCRLGIILCGTGQGIMMAANKVRGIRCGVCADTFSARMIRQHNDANMLSLGARVIGEGLALDIVDAFLAAQFEGGRHATRVDMIVVLEQ